LHLPFDTPLSAQEFFSHVRESPVADEFFDEQADSLLLQNQQRE
jgi:hypothetical protein